MLPATCVHAIAIQLPFNDTKESFERSRNVPVYIDVDISQTIVRVRHSNYKDNSDTIVVTKRTGIKQCVASFANNCPSNSKAKQKFLGKDMAAKLIVGRKAKDRVT